MGSQVERLHYIAAVKNVLIISPYFAPSNAADMQRIRMSLPYFQQFGWHAEVVCVHEKHSEMVQDKLLSESVPSSIKIHKVNALNRTLTRKIGFGSLAYRAIPYYKSFVNRLLAKQHVNLIYFSTTQFPACVLGPYWKKKFNVPYVIDMQDPWYNDYYESRPANERPPKYKLVYGLHKMFERFAMESVDGLISVSQQYLDVLTSRYPRLEGVPQKTIPFAASADDLTIAERVVPTVKKMAGHFTCIYVGRGGHDMEHSLSLLFQAIKEGLETHSELFNKLHLHFIGTSYAPSGKGKPTISSVAEQFSVNHLVTETTDRIPYFEGLATLMNADALIVPGSDSPGYTASKIYPYLMAEKPLLAIFHEESSTVNVIRTTSPQSSVVTFPGNNEQLTQNIKGVLQSWLSGRIPETKLNKEAFGPYLAESMTQKQVQLFEEVLAN